MHFYTRYFHHVNTVFMVPDLASAMKKDNESVDISPFEPCKNQAEIRTKD